MSFYTIMCIQHVMKIESTNIFSEDGWISFKKVKAIEQLIEEAKKLELDSFVIKFVEATEESYLTAYLIDLNEMESDWDEVLEGYRYYQHSKAEVEID